MSAIAPDTPEADDGDDYRSPDSTTQYRAGNDMGHEVARTVPLRPEAIGHPAAQLTGQDDREEHAPGPPVTQSSEVRPATGAPAASGLRPVRQGVR
jgi:hypothetical protein